MDLRSFGAMMSMRLILATVGGLALLVLTLVAVVTSFPAARVSSPTAALLRYSWAVGVTVGVAVLANLVAVTMSLMASGRVLDAAIAGR